MYNKKIVLTESERADIKKMYGLTEKKDFVFDFVLTENHKYLIIMDQVFVEGNNGKSIGSIWENTHIFTELIKESVGELHESVNDFLNTVEWKKELIQEWIKDKTIVNENWFDDLKSGAGELVSKIGNAAVETAKMIFNKGVLPALRWIRRGLYTGLGIVIDVVVSILAAKTNAVVWFVIVLLDIYEIGTGDFDPQDPIRMQLPFFFLFTDLLGCIFTASFAFAAKKAIPAIAKEGVEKAAPQVAKVMGDVGKKIPALKGQLKNVANSLEKSLGPKSSGVIGKIRSFIDKVLTQLMEFISKLMSKNGLKAATTGGLVLGAGHLTSKAISSLDKEDKMGNTIMAYDQKIKDATGVGNLVISPEEGNAIMSVARA